MVWMVVQAVVKANSQSNEEGPFLP